MASFEQQKLLQQQLRNQQPWNPSHYFDQHVVDQFIISQNEKLRQVMQEESKHQLWRFLKEIETRASTLVKQKDEEIQKARNKTTKLELVLKKLEMDKHAWERVAHQNQEAILFLNNKLEILKEKTFGRSKNEVEDAESCCEWVKTDEGPVCKGCNRRSSCVLFLPCRHLCSCKDCELLLDSCPVCATPKKGSIEALFS